MCPFIGDGSTAPNKLINCEGELKWIQTAIDALVSNKSLLSTPIIDFFGIDGIGKSRILEEISVICVANNLPCIKLDATQNIDKIYHAILQQTQQYSAKKNPIGRDDPHAQTVDTIKALLENKPVVILLDSIDTSNEELVTWIKAILRELMEHDNLNLFVVLTSKQKFTFENDWVMARKLTRSQLKPLNRRDSRTYLDALDDTISSETREVILQWTRGYPLAMEVMTKAILQHHFDIENSEDQKQLITLIIEEIIDKKVLAHVEPSHLDWYKAHFLLLSIPRRFNLNIMQELLETFGIPPIGKRKSKLEYMSLPKELNRNIDIILWDEQKAGFTLDESIRHIFLVHQRVHNFPLFIRANKYLAERTMTIANNEVTGSDSVRYLYDYLYYCAQSYNFQTIETILHPTLEGIINMYPSAASQFNKYFSLDNELQEYLGNHCETVRSIIREYLAEEE